MLSSLTRLLGSRLDRWLFANPYLSVRGMAAYRIFFALYLLLFFTPGQETYLLTGYSDLPDSLFGPPLGPMMFFTALPSAGAIDAGTLILTLALVVVCIGWQTRAATAVASLTLFWLVGVENSLGKLNESQTFTALMLAVMVFSPWGRALSVDSIIARRRGQVSPPSDEGLWVGQVVALLLGVAFASAGVEKLLGGWLSPGSHATEFYADQFLFRGDGTSLTEALLQADIGLLWEFGDYGTVLFEMGFIVAAFKLSWLRAFCAFALVFHTLNYAILNISFATLLVVYALFLPWDEWLRTRQLKRLANLCDAWSPSTLLPLATAVVVALSIGAIFNQVGSPLVAMLELLLPFQDPRTEVIHALSLVVAAVYLLQVARRLSMNVHGRRPEPA